MIKTINTLFVTMLGLGKVPKIPGTFGSLATIIILYVFFHIFNNNSLFIISFMWPAIIDTDFARMFKKHLPSIDTV